MVEAIFSFVPCILGTFEKFYDFHIEKYNLTTNFLMVGVAREPCVFFSTPHLTLNNTVTGIDVADHVTLKNNENVDLLFRFKKYSTYSEGREQKLNVEPLEGSLAAESETKIKLAPQITD